MSDAYRAYGRCSQLRTTARSRSGRYSNPACASSMMVCATQCGTAWVTSIWKYQAIG